MKRRWLDKAAVRVEDEEQQPAPRNRFEQVKAVKFQLKMLPLWATFLTFSLVAATGRSFFLIEALSNRSEIRWLYITLQFLIVLVTFVRFIVAEVSDYVLQKCFKENNVAQRMLLVRVGVGMMCCVLCCVAAWANSKKLRENWAEMRIFIMITPQFALLGFMEGFARDGLETLFKSQVSKSTSRQYGAPFIEFVMGYGCFVGAVCILVFRGHPFGWFKKDVRSSHLGKYYHFLMILSSANFAFYVFVAYWYGDGTFSSEDPRADAEGFRSSDQELGGSQCGCTRLTQFRSRTRRIPVGGSQCRCRRLMQFR